MPILVLIEVCVALAIALVASIVFDVRGMSADRLHHGVNGDPSALLVTKPMPNCPTVGQAGLHTQDVPEAKSFAYATQAYGGFCAAVLYAHGNDVEISSSKPVAWAALYDIRTNGQHMSYGLVFSYGSALIADNASATSTSGTSFHAVPTALYVFALPSVDPVSQDTAEAALPQIFVGQNNTFYPMIQIAGDYGLPQSVSILDGFMRNTPMK